MLIQNGYLQTMKFTTAQRTAQGPWAVQIILPHPGGICAWHCSLAKGNFSHSLQQQESCFLVKLLWTGPVVDSVETEAQKQSVIPEAISEPRTSASCSIPAAWFVSEVTNTVPSWNSSSLLSPGHLVVMAEWRTGFVSTFCFHSYWSLATSVAQVRTTGFSGLYLALSMSSRVALALFHPLGMDTKGQTGSIGHKAGLKPHLKAWFRLCTGKTFSPMSLQAKELWCKLDGN